MDFINVTLHQDQTDDIKVENLKKYEDYLLPISAIKRIWVDERAENSYFIEIIENYLPNGIGFTPDYASVKLPKGFVNTINL